MTALTSPRKIQRRGVELEPYSFDVKASSTILQTALVVLLAGVAIAGRAGVDSTEAGTMQCVGVAYNGGAVGGAADGDVKIEVSEGTFAFKNSASGDLITKAEIGKVCYVVDDQTVAKTSNTNVRCIAGRVKQVDSDGTVWVHVGPGLAA